MITVDDCDKVSEADGPEVMLSLGNEGRDPIDVQVGLTVRRVRRQSGISQEKLGSALGLSFQQVQKYERGVNRISASALVKIAQALGVRAADLLPANDAPDVPAYAKHLAPVRGAEELLNDFASLRSTAKRRVVLMLVRALVADEHSGVESVDG